MGIEKKNGKEWIKGKGETKIRGSSRNKEHVQMPN